MVQSKETTVAGYLKSLPPERREVIAAVRKDILATLPKGYVETMDWGMISYQIPLKTYADTYNGKPLMYMALAAQKNNYAFYTTCGYSDPKIAAWIQAEFRKAGKRLDMGKSCIRFRKLEDLPPGLVRTLSGKFSVAAFLEQYEKTRAKSSG